MSSLMLQTSCKVFIENEKNIIHNKEHFIRLTMNVILRFIFACISAVYGASVDGPMSEGDGHIFDEQTKRYTNLCSLNGTRIEANNQNCATTFTFTHPNQDKTRIVFSRAEDTTKNVSITCTAIQTHRDLDLIRIVLAPLCPDFTSLQFLAKPSPEQPSPAQASLSPFVNATLQGSQAVSHYQAEVHEDFFILRYKIPKAGISDYCLMMIVKVADSGNLEAISCSIKKFNSNGGLYNSLIATRTYALADGFHSKNIHHDLLPHADNALRNLNARSQQNTEHLIDVRRDEYFRLTNL